MTQVQEPEVTGLPTRHRGFRFALDPTGSQEAMFRQMVGAARMAYNTYVAEARARKERWDTERARLVEHGLGGKELSQAMREAASAAENTPYPMKGLSAYEFEKHWLTAARANHKDRAEAIAVGQNPEVVMAEDHYTWPWLHKVPRRVQVSGIRNAGRAWTNWMDSLTGERSGPKVGFPKRKRRGSRDSFTIPHPEKMGARGTTWGRGKHTQRIDDYRHVYAAFLGSIRTHENTRRLVRSIERGGQIRSFTLSRGGTRWYISFLIEEPFTPPSPSKAQKVQGAVGVDLGVKASAALSNGEITENPRYGDREKRRITKLQRKIARAQKGSKRRGRLQRTLADTHHRIAKRRETHAHRITKSLTTKYARIGVEDLNVAGMTASAAGTIEAPGTNVAAKSGLNRQILDASFARIRRQLEYKTSWYGSELIVIYRFHPSSKTCSACGTVKTKLALSQRVFTCECGYRGDRDVNAASNIAAEANILAYDRWESLNGRGGPHLQLTTLSSANRSIEASRPPGLSSLRGSPGASNDASFPT